MESDEYFTSYGEIATQALMLRDRPRTAAYAAAIRQNSAHIKGKVVMDVGAGTGLLSVLCAQAGASRVLAVEASVGAFHLLEKVIAHNKVSHVVTPILSTVEDLTLSTDLMSVVQPEGKPRSDNEDRKCVDVIVSEWMGFFGLHESMLCSVIAARDKWMKPSGLILPSQCDIKISLTSCPKLWESQVGWISSKIEGVDFSCLTDQLMSEVLMRPGIETLFPSQCDFASTPTIVSLDLYTVNESDLSSIVRDVVISVRSSPAGDGQAHAYAIWFDVRFPYSTGPIDTQSNEIVKAVSGEGESLGMSISRTTTSTAEGGGGDFIHPVVLSTSPFSSETHWKQTILYLQEPKVCPSGLRLKCCVGITRDGDNSRLYNIHVEVVEVSLDGEVVGDEDSEEGLEGG